jgi:hypothetical protein
MMTSEWPRGTGREEKRREEKGLLIAVHVGVVILAASKVAVGW